MALWITKSYRRYREMENALAFALAAGNGRRG
jgi:hypothetical protein